jgi:hypothetical protein
MQAAEVLKKEGNALFSVSGSTLGYTRMLPPELLTEHALLLPDLAA